jgi:hypothetical protein
MFRSFQAIVFNRLEQNLRILLTQTVLFFSVENLKTGMFFWLPELNYAESTNLFLEYIFKKCALLI